MTVVDKDQIEDRLDAGVLGQWYVVAKSVQVKPGAPHAVKVLGRHLVLWRDEAGRVHCLEDYCPHRGARLSRGEITGDNISCRYHGVTLDGSRHDRARAGDAGLRARRPQGGGQLHRDRGERRRVRLFPERGASAAVRIDAAGRVLRSGLEQHAVHGPLELQPSLRLRQLRRPDARLLPACRLRSRSPSAPSRTSCRSSKRDDGFYIARVEQRDVNLDWTHVVRRRHPGLLPARHSVSGRGRSGRTVPHHRLCDAGR